MNDHVLLIGAPSRAPLKVTVYDVFGVSGAKGSRIAVPALSALFTSAVAEAVDPVSAADGKMMRAGTLAPPGPFSVKLLTVSMSPALAAFTRTIIGSPGEDRSGAGLGLSPAIVVGNPLALVSGHDAIAVVGIC